MAEQFLDDIGFSPDELLPDWIRPYVSIDLNGLGQAMSADLVVAEDNDGVHVFEAA